MDFETWAKSKLAPFMNEKGEVGTVVEVAIGLTILTIVLGYIFAPVGLTAMAGVNTTAAGVSTGSNASIWNALVPVILAALILAVVMIIKKAAQ